jgi:hypothetical protein
MNSIQFIKWRSVPLEVVKIAETHKESLAKLAEGRFETSDLANHIRTAFNTMRLGKGQDLFGNNVDPNPLVGALVGGLAGGGLGYAGGTMASYLLPPDWKKERLGRTSAIVGALAGMAPGVGLAGMNMAGGLPPWSSEMYKASGDTFLEDVVNYCDEETMTSIKQAISFGSGMGGPIAIPVDDFNRTVWGDRRVSDLLDLPEKAAITGLVSGASRLPGKNRSSLVTPFDIGRMAAGMGSGYVSGAIVGKGLSALFGMPPDKQDNLKNTGVWAGAIKGMLPLLF